MIRILHGLVCLCISLACCFAQDSYRDPSGRFTVAVPPGWHASSSAGQTTIGVGEAYARIIVLAGAAADSPAVRKAIEQQGSAWKRFELAHSATETLGGLTGASAIYTGVDPDGSEALLKTVRVVAGRDVYILAMFAPASMLSGVKAGFDQIQLSFALGAPRKPAADLWPEPERPQAQPQPPRPVAEPQLSPLIFQRAGPPTAPGVALSATVGGNLPLRVVHQRVLASIAQFFDRPPVPTVAWSDREGTQMQCLFLAVQRGVDVRGLITVSASGGDARVSVLYDRRETFSETLPALNQQLVVALGGSPAAPAAPEEPLTTTRLSDGGTVGLPPCWQVVNYGEGGLDLSCPSASAIGSFGGTLLVFLPGINPSAPFVGQYRNPEAAYYLFIDQFVNRGVFSSGRGRYRIREQQMVPYPGGQGAFLDVSTEAGPERYRMLILIYMAPVASDRWALYFSYVAAPEDRFERMIPSMWRMWRSYHVSDAVLQGRLREAERNLSAISGIVREAGNNRSAVLSGAARAWSDTIRGVTTVEDTLTGRRGQVNIDVEDEVLNGLNRGGQRYRAVPIHELGR